jgi:hypothetical protein
MRPDSLSFKSRKIATERYLKRLRERPSPTAAAVSAGPRCLAGTALSALLKKFGINPDEKGCKCRLHAAHMDAAGCDWCEQNIETIVGWLREEATKRGLPFVDVAGRLLVRRAIRNARRAAKS